MIDSSTSKDSLPLWGGFISFHPLASKTTCIGSQRDITSIDTVIWKIIEQYGIPTMIETGA